MLLRIILFNCLIFNKKETKEETSWNTTNPYLAELLPEDNNDNIRSTILNNTG